MLENEVEYAVHVAASQQVARSCAYAASSAASAVSSFRSQVGPEQYEAAESVDVSYPVEQPGVDPH